VELVVPKGGGGRSNIELQVVRRPFRDNPKPLKALCLVFGARHQLDHLKKLHYHGNFHGEQGEGVFHQVKKAFLVCSHLVREELLRREREFFWLAFD